MKDKVSANVIIVENGPMKPVILEKISSRGVVLPQTKTELAPVREIALNMAEERGYEQEEYDNQSRANQFFFQSGASARTGTRPQRLR